MKYPVKDLSRGVVLYPNHQIDHIHGRTLGEFLIDEVVCQTIFDVDKIPGVHIVEMVVMAVIGVVEGAARIDEDLAYQPFPDKQPQGIVDRGFGNPGTSLIQHFVQLLGRHVLIACKQGVGDDSPLPGQIDAAIDETLFDRVSVL